MATNSTYDAVVVGLGAFGSAAACSLAGRGVKVRGLDRYRTPHARGSSHGGSRMIREAYFEAPFYVPLVQYAYDRWDALERKSRHRLLERTGGLMLGAEGGGLLSLGSFYVYLGPPQAVAAEAAWRLDELTNEVYYSDNSALYSVPAAYEWTLSFREIEGFEAPAQRTLVLSADETTSVMAYYRYTNSAPWAERPVISSDEVFQFSFLARAGDWLAVQESTNLLDWVSVLTNQVPEDGLLHFINTHPPAKNKKPHISIFIVTAYDIGKSSSLRMKCCHPQSCKKYKK